MRVSIDSLAYGGEGVAVLEDGRKAFVSSACTGDVADISIDEDHGRYVKASITELIEASPSRVEPPCPFFAECGGCQWQHVAYELQLESKRNAVADCMSRIGGIEPAGKVNQCVPSAAQYGYRNKVELLVAETSGRLELGFARAGTDSVIPISECMLLPKSAKKYTGALQGALRYLSRGRELGLARVGLRVAANTRDIEVALWTEPGAFPRQFVADAISDAVGASSVVRCLFKGPIVHRKVSKVEVLKGKGAWRERLLGRDMLASAPSFFQVNTQMAEELARAVSGAVANSSASSVADLYCGAGTFTLPLAAQIDETVCVESSRYALADLRRNLASAGVEADVVAGDVAREIADLGEFDAIVVDPPKAGLAPELAEAIGSMQPRLLVYVSCDPATLARDASLLQKHGMALMRATPMDLFPQTYHVETVAEFAPQ